MDMCSGDCPDAVAHCSIRLSAVKEQSDDTIQFAIGTGDAPFQFKIVSVECTTRQSRFNRILLLRSIPDTTIGYNCCSSDTAHGKHHRTKACKSNSDGRHKALKNANTTPSVIVTTELCCHMNQGNAKQPAMQSAAAKLILR